MAVGLLVCPLEAVASDDQPGFSLSFGVEPRVGSYQKLDPLLDAYGFNEVGARLALMYGLRGRIWTTQGWIVGGTMNYGFSKHQRGDNPVPTTITRLETMFTVGHQLGAGFDLSLAVGFGSQAMGVGSTTQGGALVYLGPALAPGLGYVPPMGSGFLRISVGYSVLFPVGDAHEQPLWGESFRQFPIHALVFGIESGFALNLPRECGRSGASR